MCGRYTLSVDLDTLQAEFNLESIPQSLPPRYNIAPSQPVAVALRGSNNGWVCNP